MERTKRTSNLSCKTVAQKVDTQENVECPTTSTPTHHSVSYEPETGEEYSPIFSQYSQEDNSDIEVIWDWNSPKSKPRFPRKKKRHLQHSPKLTIKRQPSNQMIPTFHKLKEELEALQGQIFINKQNKHGAASSNCIVINLANPPEDICSRNKSFEDIFEDESMEERLVLCSQQVENKLQTNQNTSNEANCSLLDSFHKTFQLDLSNNKQDQNGNNKDDISIINFAGKKIDNICDKKRNVNDVPSKNIPIKDDDSFDLALEAFKDEDIELLSQAMPLPKTEDQKANTNTALNLRHLPNIAVKTTSETNVVTSNNNINQLMQFPSDNFQWSRVYQRNEKGTSIIDIKKNNFADRMLQFASRSAESVLPQVSTSNNSTCSLAEIERKRLQALAKLEAKRKLEIINRNHLDASIKSSCREIENNFLQLPTQHKPSNLLEETSPIKCSPEEIEQKRLQALAKLEAKKKQDIIERNRLEALKRLELNKKRRALLGQNSLQSKSTL